MKSLGLNYEQFQRTILGNLWIVTKGYYCSIRIQFHRKGIDLLLERNKAFIPRDLIVNIQAISTLNEFNFGNYIVLLSNFYYYIKV